jgi:hypothetical protein
LWCSAFIIGHVVFAFSDCDAGEVIVLFVAQFVAILIPHGFAMRMGNRAEEWTNLDLRRYWPGAWVLKVGIKDHLLQDFLGMMSVGLLRGAAVYLPMLFFNYTEISLILAAVLAGFLQPLFYFIGSKIPVASLGNHKQSTEWGEFLIGLQWAICEAVLIWM